MRRSPERSRHDAIVESAIEMLVVSATSSGSQPASEENERFSAPIRGKMSSNQTWSGAPFVSHASMYSSRNARERRETGPSDALIRYVFRSSTGNSSRQAVRSIYGRAGMKRSNHSVVRATRSRYAGNFLTPCPSPG